ncbi:39S ribosomal protein L24 [Thecamonas trahens ATCC 50062]|uniref:39S ribosomal protein L24 n=1 Tax=Thecamonas trahens ATCC 50062 TaxID=461836 RepID=A0A0L0DA62_THETB|nr:39S ribosomal protein L24 [Thecamonas trahens ATCC 50062]KNC48183.1 39S ribosomal protein L24 [Thecamonas trahens ATCC 50062]|eukprot:XP_013758752.1 39S ribosomal protein L24 [Thecamonas trahens ATCC 50062]
MSFRVKRRVVRAAMDAISSWKVVKGDTVVILAGRDAGRQGVVEKVLRKKNKVIVDGLNLVKKHMRKTEVLDGGIFTKSAAVPVANVALLDPIDGKPTRAGWARDEAGKRIRISKRSGEPIPRPILPRRVRDVAPELDAALDTSAEVVAESTFVPFKIKL